MTKREAKVLRMAGPFKVDSYIEGHLRVEPEYKEVRATRYVIPNDDCSPVGMVDRMALAAVVERILQAAWKEAVKKGKS